MLQPGERLGCVGCHESRVDSPPVQGLPAALRRPPSSLADWYGPARKFSYAAEVQPVLDNLCVRCHDHGGEAHALNLWCLVLCALCLVLGAWCLVHGALCFVLCAWCLVLGAWCLVLGAWCSYSYSYSYSYSILDCVGDER